MKKLLAVVLTLAMSVCVFAGCGDKNTSDNTDSDKKTEAGSDTASGSYTAKEGVLTMATNAYFPPYEYYEGSDIVGIDVEIAKAVAEELGLELKVEDMEFDSIITAVQAGKADIGLAGMTVTEDRLKFVNFSDTYATGVQVVIVKEDSDIKSLDDLEGKKIGVQLTTTGDIYATDEFGSDFVEQYNKGNDAVMALVSGKIDAVIIDNEPAKSFVAANEGLKILDTEYAVEDYAAAMNKDNDELLEKFNTALKKLTEDGTVADIIEKYIPAN